MSNSFSNSSELNSKGIALATEMRDWFDKAKIENSQFGAISEKLFSFLLEYKSGDIIPEEYWTLYGSLVDSVDKDISGKLLFTETQNKVKTALIKLMLLGGLAITLLDKELLHKQLLSIANDFPHSHFLEATFFSPLLENSGKNVEVVGFSQLLLHGFTKGQDVLKDHKLLIETVGKDEATQILAEIKPFFTFVLLPFPGYLIDNYWTNPEAAKFLKQPFKDIGEELINSHFRK